MQNIYQTFEFNKIKLSILEYSKTELGQEYIDSLEMMSSSKDVSNALEDLKEMMSIIVRFGVMPIATSANALKLIEMAKKSGKIDYKSCEYEAHLVECAKREEKMNEYTEDQPSREDIFNYLDAIEQFCSKEELIQSLKDDWDLSTSSATRWLKAYRRAHMDESVEKMNEFVDANGDEYTADDIFNFLNIIRI